MENGDFLLRIDDLLDFSNQEEEEEEEGVGREEEEEEEEEEIAGRLSASDWPQQQQRLSSSIEYTASAPLLLSNVELCVPREDMAHLEWLSNFEESMSSNVDASLCGTSHGFSITPKLLGQSCSVNKEENQSYGCGYGYAYGDRGGGLIEASEEEFGLLSRRRRKPRLRTTWDSRVMLIDYSDARASPAASVLFESPSSTSTVTDSGDDRTHFLLPSKKKVKVEKTEKAEKMIETSPVGRKCLHCAVTKTPQWRAGPQGPKTLCNACGVRYKSGRLLPEYRPAASPTFVHTLHSNSHRKVVEMHKLRHQSGNNNDDDGDGDDDDVNDSIGMARYKPWEMKPQNPKILNPYAPKPQNPKIPKP